MSRVLVLDAEAMNALGRPSSHPGFGTVLAALEAARRLRRNVVVPAVVLAELFRGGGHNQIVDACLARETALLVRNTDRPLAKLVGGVLAAAAGSADLVDAHGVAVAVQAGGGVILTGDVDDMVRLVGAFPNVHVAEV